ncbi:MAG: hypothetical protein IPN76_26930 [Saprospiraceae bacterium]|nr:hypothetical protein [Saprospiraceae bacterium]
MRQKGVNEFSDYRIMDEDIANGAEAYLRIFGSQVAFDWLKRWKPKKAVFRATSHLLDEIVRYSTEEQLIDWLKPITLPIYVNLLILEKVDFTKSNPFDINRLADSILKMLSRGVKFKVRLLPSIISFCELYISLNCVNKEVVLKILEYINIQITDRVPSFMDDF